MIRALAPWRERMPRSLARFEHEMEEMMQRFFHPEETWFGGGEFMPPTNVAETETGIEVTVELAGMKPEEFAVEVKNGQLWIAGEKKEEHEEKGKTFHRVERRYGQFRRVVTLPAEVNAEKVAARYEGGVLTVTVPKNEKAIPKMVKVEAK